MPMILELRLGGSANITEADVSQAEFGTTVADPLAAGSVPVSGPANSCILDVLSSATCEVSDDGLSWRPMKRGDTGANVTALGAGSYPVAIVNRRIRCTSGAVRLRPLIRS